MTLIIDRFEQNFAICQTQDGEDHIIERGRIPAQAREGDVLVERTPGEYVIDTALTLSCRQEARALLDELFKGDEPTR